jgi:uncharacterized small protein (DUF1192 family)
MIEPRPVVVSDAEVEARLAAAHAEIHRRKTEREHLAVEGAAPTVLGLDAFRRGLLDAAYGPVQESEADRD